MQPHQQRVVDEKIQLDDKVSKLGDFIKESSVYRTMNPHDQQLLNRQHAIMQDYSQILGQRIDRFTQD